MRIASSGKTRKALVGRLQQADANHATRLIRRVQALVELGDGKSVWETAPLPGVGEQHPGGTRRDWLHAFVVNGVAGPVDRPRPGRPAKLTASQRQEVRDLLRAGPEAAG